MTAKRTNKIADEAAECAEAEADRAVDAEHAEQLREMYDLHRRVGRAALQKALDVLNQVTADDIPMPVAVQLLKFGAELERRALLGIEPDEDDDPFAELVKAMSDGD